MVRHTLSSSWIRGWQAVGKRRGIAWVAVLGVSLTTVSGEAARATAETSTSAGAQPTAETSTSAGTELGTRQSDDDALAQDLGLVASSREWTTEQASARHRAAEVIGQIAEQVFTTRPEIFVGSALSDDPDGAPTLYIKGPADDFVRELVSSAEVPVILADQQPYSFDELEARKLQVHHALVALGFRYVSTGFDITNEGHIEAAVTREAGLPDNGADLLLALPAALRASVTITVSEEPVVTDEASGGQ